MNKTLSRVLVGLGIAGFLLVGGGFLFIYIAFSGGVEGAIADLRRRPDPDSLRGERESAERRLATELDETLDGFQQFAHARHDLCHEGQNNFKVKDGFGHRCSLKLTRFYGFNGDFRSTVRQLDDRLQSDSWRPESLTMEEILTQYLDRAPSNFDQVVRVERLPDPCYQRRGVRFCLTFAERGTTDAFGLEHFQQASGGINPFHEEKEVVEVEGLLRQVTASQQYVLGAAAEFPYFIK